MKKDYQKHAARKFYGPGRWPAGAHERDLFDEAVANTEADLVVAVDQQMINSWAALQKHMNKAANLQRALRERESKLKERLHLQAQHVGPADAELKAQQEEIRLVEGYLGAAMYRDMPLILRPRESLLMELSYPRRTQRKISERQLARLTKHPRRKLARVRAQAREKLIPQLKQRVNELPPHLQARLPEIRKRRGGRPPEP